MKVLCPREQLREGLAVINNVVPSKSAKPILSNVCLVATDDALELAATDMEMALRYRIHGVKVQDPGTMVVPGRVAMEFVRDLTGETVEIESTRSACFLRSDTDGCELVSADPDEFPVVPRFSSDDALSLPGGTFTRLVGRTAFATAREAGRYAMHGVLIELQEGVLKMVATDGRRLAVTSCPVDIDERKKLERPVIVPTKGMQLFCRVIADPLDPIQISFEDSQIGVRTRDAEVFARLLDGEFPRYSAVIPTETSHTVEANGELLSRKLRLVANVAGDEARSVRLSLKKGALEIFGRSAGRGEARAHMEVDFRGKPAEIAFNPDYVLDGLKNAEVETVRLEFNDKTAPGKFTLGENYVYIVMPITIDS